MKKLQFIFLIPFGLVGLFILWGWIQAFMAFDISDEHWKREHYKWRLEGMQEFDCQCKLFEGNQFTGTVLSYSNPSGKGADDIIEIKINNNSDTVFLQNTVINNYLGRTECKINNGVLTFFIGPGRGPQDLASGDIVKKTRDKKHITFKGDYGTKILDPYYRFEDEYRNCLDVDTMNVFQNLRQYLKYDSLSRVSDPLDYRTIEYMTKRIEEQNKK